MKSILFDATHIWLAYVVAIYDHDTIKYTKLSYYNSIRHNIIVFNEIVYNEQLINKMQVKRL